MGKLNIDKLLQEVLEGFPVLKGVDISIGWVDAKDHLAPEFEYLFRNFMPLYFSWPKPTYFLPFGKKKYIIGLNRSTTDKRTPAIFDRLSPQAQRGAIAHEVAHIIRYEKLTKIQNIWDLTRYTFSESYREIYEKETDKLAIAFGFDEDIRAWVRETYQIKIDEQKGRDKTYNSEEEIDLLIEECASAKELSLVIPFVTIKYSCLSLAA